MTNNILMHIPTARCVEAKTDRSLEYNSDLTMYFYDLVDGYNIIGDFSNFSPSDKFEVAILIKKKDETE